jgi:hypothetical protein
MFTYQILWLQCADKIGSTKAEFLKIVGVSRELYEQSILEQRVSDIGLDDVGIKTLCRPG